MLELNMEASSVPAVDARAERLASNLHLHNLQAQATALWSAQKTPLIMDDSIVPVYQLFNSEFYSNL